MVGGVIGIKNYRIGACRKKKPERADGISCNSTRQNWFKWYSVEFIPLTYFWITTLCERNRGLRHMEKSIYQKVKTFFFYPSDKSGIYSVKRDQKGCTFN